MLLRDCVDKSSVVVDSPSVGLRVEHSIIFGYEFLVIWRVHFLNEPLRKILAQDTFVEVVCVSRKDLLIDLRPVGEETAAHDGGVFL